MSPPAPRGVIHDIGYRRFTGQRQGVGAVALALYVTSLRHCFGLGRSGKSKIVPFFIAGIMLIPALVLAGIIIQLNKMSMSAQADLLGPVSNYFGFPYWTQLLITVFAAAQAPVLFARDLRYRTVVLYFARPLSRTSYVLVRLAALTTALFAVVAVPMTIWYGVALSTDLDKGEHTRHYLAALVGVALLAMMLAAFSGMIAALTTRAGLAVAAIIVGLMVTSGVVSSMLAAAYDNGQKTFGHVAAAFNPFTLVAEFISGAFDQPTPTQTLLRPGTGWTMAYALIVIVWIAGTTWVLLARTKKAASL